MRTLGWDLEQRENSVQRGEGSKHGIRQRANNIKIISIQTIGVGRGSQRESFGAGVILWFKNYSDSNSRLAEPVALFEKASGLEKPFSLAKQNSLRVKMTEIFED